MVTDLIDRPEVFSDEYIPPELPGREDAVERVQLVMQRGTGNVIIQGHTGVGKTAVIRYVQRQCNSDVPVYMQASGELTYKRFVENIARALHVDYSVSHDSANDIMDKIHPAVDRRFHVVVDDIHHMKPSEIAKVISTPQDCLPEMSLMLITNKANLFTKIRNRYEEAWNRLSPRPISLPPYTKDDLKDILMHRAEAGLVDEADAGCACILIAALVTRKANADARIAIQTLQAAVDEAALDDRMEVTDEDARTALTNVLSTNQSVKLEMLDAHEKILFYKVIFAPGAKFGHIRSEYETMVDDFSKMPRINAPMSPVDKSNVWRKLRRIEDVGLIRYVGRRYYPNDDDKILKSMAKNILRGFGIVLCDDDGDQWGAGSDERFERKWNGRQRKVERRRKRSYR